MNRTLRHCLPGLCLLTAGLLLGACASTDSRIRDQQTAFDTYPPAVQQKIRAGEIDVGFTPEMTRMALGDPDRRYTRTTANGSDEVWAYRESSPAFSFGIGGGSFGGHGFGGGGVAMSSGGDAPDDKLRAVFENGKVVSVEKTLK
ncbi:MAG: hypothetical protein JWR16_1611 [Nevskia sp.]|nr:hypothetical protein [Nevskia sp.]